MPVRDDETQQRFGRIVRSWEDSYQFWTPERRTIKECNRGNSYIIGTSAPSFSTPNHFSRTLSISVIVSVNLAVSAKDDKQCLEK